MSKFLGWLVAGPAVLAGILGIILLFMVLGPAIGALAGVVVNWVFPATMAKVLAAIGLGGIKLWELGAFLGFVSVFVKASQTNNNK